MRRDCFRWARGLFAILALAVAAAGFSASGRAQDMAGADGPPAAAVAPATVSQLRALVSTLEDETARAALVRQLQTLIVAQEALAAPSAAAQAPVLETLGSRAMDFIAGRLDALRRQTGPFAGDIRELPRITDWATRQIVDPEARERWLHLGAGLGVTLAASGVAAWLLAWMLRGARRRLGAQSPGSPWGKLPFLVLRAILELLPIAVFAMVAYGVLSAIDPPQRVRLAALAVVNASILTQGVLVAARALLSPLSPGLRLLRVGDETAGYIHVWTRRLAIVAVYGYFVVEAAYVLGLPLAAYGTLLKLLGLLLAAMLIVLILQNRRPVADWLQGAAPTPRQDGEEAAGDGPGSAGGGRVLHSARRGLAGLWHILAIVYVLVTLGFWILNVYGGFEYLARATAATLIVAIVARLVTGALGLALERAFRIAGSLRDSLPDLEARANLYLPLINRGLGALVWTAAALAVLHAWGVDSLAWADTPFGRRLLGSGLTLVLIVVVAVLAWELVSAVIERYLAETDRFGTRIERSARARTLLPLLRNALLVVLVTMVGLAALSELGVNIAPLLAGAGVVGLAVGFGSQTLVKDVITGLFILFEDTISVGDVVDVGGGHSGVVEAISIRTIRLRDLAGSVHSVPFSAVTTVKNMTKDFSFAVFDVSVDYKEDTDRVIAALNEIGAGMRADPEFARDILAPLEVFGVDRLADSGMVIKARFKTKPVRQWAVGREFNRRLKKRFAELGISIPYPHMQLVMRPGAGPVGEPAPDAG